MSYCCRVHHLGCPPTAPPAPPVFVPPPPAGPVDPYNCAEGFSNWMAGWSVGKKEWCCRVHGKGCPGQAAGCAPAAPPPPPAPQGPVDPYNCALGYVNWEAGWSLEKKRWCCNEHGKGCGHDGPAVANMYDCNAGTENWVKGWSENKKQWCCSHGYPSCPSDASAVVGVGYGAGSHGGRTPEGAPVFGHEVGFVPHEMATKGTYSNVVPR